MKNLLLLFALLLSGWATPSLAQSSCVEITSVPANITVPGNYCLTGNKTVNMTAGAAINIAASDVVLDCLNFSIRNNATANTGSSAGIALTNRHAVTVKNCRILGGFTHGIIASQSASAPNANYYLTFEDNFIAGPYLHGIFANGSAIEIRNNRIYDIGGQLNTFAIGIRVGGSNVSGQPRFHVVKDNLVAGVNSAYNNAYGIYSDNSLAGIFIYNGVTGTTATNPSFRSYGFKLVGTVNRISNNHVVGSGLENDTGISASSTTTSCYENYIRAAVDTQTCDASLGND